MDDIFPQTVIYALLNGRIHGSVLVNIRPETERPLLQHIDDVSLDKAALLKLTNVVRS